jgi:hypothetical protein
MPAVMALATVSAVGLMLALTWRTEDSDYALVCELFRLLVDEDA